MTRTLVLVVFLAAWLATGIVAGIVMGRRHNQFSWSLLGVAFGALMVPLALGRECREEPTSPAGSLSAPQDRSVPVLLSINDSREAATTLTATATRSSTETSYHDILPIGATPDKPRMRVGRT
jgi:hypothetical protein